MSVWSGGLSARVEVRKEGTGRRTVAEEGRKVRERGGERKESQKKRERLYEMKRGN